MKFREEYIINITFKTFYKGPKLAINSFRCPYGVMGDKTSLLHLLRRICYLCPYDFVLVQMAFCLQNYFVDEFALSTGLCFIFFCNGCGCYSSKIPTNWIVSLQPKHATIQLLVIHPMLLLIFVSFLSNVLSVDQFDEALSVRNSFNL